MKQLLFLFLGTWTLLGDDVRVLVWDERQPAQKQAYPHFLGNTLASHLNSLPGISALATSLDAPDKGISEGRLDAADVLIWWGHVRQAEITPEDCRPIIERIKAGRLGFIALHSAHWATPFMEAMNERTRMDAAKKFTPSPSTPKVAFEWVAPPGRISPSWASLVTPAYLAYQRHGVVTTVRVDLPNCCFPAWRNDGKPSQMLTVAAGHPIAAGLPKQWTLPATEMYAEPFHVPEPDRVIFKEIFSQEEWFRSGCLWHLEKGKIFYFRPGHETHPIFTQELPLKVMENTVRWMGHSKSAN